VCAQVHAVFIVVVFAVVAHAVLINCAGLI